LTLRYVYRCTFYRFVTTDYHTVRYVSRSRWIYVVYGYYRLHLFYHTHYTFGSRLFCVYRLRSFGCPHFTFPLRITLICTFYVCGCYAFRSRYGWITFTVRFTLPHVCYGYRLTLRLRSLLPFVHGLRYVCLRLRSRLPRCLILRLVTFVGLRTLRFGLRSLRLRLYVALHVPFCRATFWFYHTARYAFYAVTFVGLLLHLDYGLHTRFAVALHVYPLLLVCTFGCYALQLLAHTTFTFTCVTFGWLRSFGWITAFTVVTLVVTAHRGLLRLLHRYVTLPVTHAGWFYTRCYRYHTFTRLPVCCYVPFVGRWLRLPPHSTGYFTLHTVVTPTFTRYVCYRWFTRLFTHVRVTVRCRLRFCGYGYRLPFCTHILRTLHLCHAFVSTRTTTCGYTHARGYGYVCFRLRWLPVLRLPVGFDLQFVPVGYVLPHGYVRLVTVHGYWLRSRFWLRTRYRLPGLPLRAVCGWFDLVAVAAFGLRLVLRLRLPRTARFAHVWFYGSTHRTRARWITRLRLRYVVTVAVTRFVALVVAVGCCYVCGYAVVDSVYWLLHYHTLRYVVRSRSVTFGWFTHAVACITHILLRLVCYTFTVRCTTFAVTVRLRLIHYTLRLLVGCCCCRLYGWVDFVTFVTHVLYICTCVTVVAVYARGCCGYGLRLRLVTFITVTYTHVAFVAFVTRSAFTFGYHFAFRLRLPHAFTRLVTVCLRLRFTRGLHGSFTHVYTRTRYGLLRLRLLRCYGWLRFTRSFTRCTAHTVTVTFAGLRWTHVVPTVCTPVRFGSVSSFYLPVGYGWLRSLLRCWLVTFTTFTVGYTFVTFDLRV